MTKYEDRFNLPLTEQELEWKEKMVKERRTTFQTKQSITDHRGNALVLVEYRESTDEWRVGIRELAFGDGDRDHWEYRKLIKEQATTCASAVKWVDYFTE